MAVNRKTPIIARRKVTLTALLENNHRLNTGLTDWLDRNPGIVRVEPTGADCERVRVSLKPVGRSISSTNQRSSGSSTGVSL